MRKKSPDRQRMKERWRDVQEISGGPFRIGAIDRHRQFSLLHLAAKARAKGNAEGARTALDMSKAARTEQWVNRLSPMALIEKRHLPRRDSEPR
ncbi:MAG TPA: hypothetical protein VHN20_03055 [Beijerinckiaceae bacterium]|nr:hypothetical protein [Beijerinckiaceae bacterium]